LDYIVTCIYHGRNFLTTITFSITATFSTILIFITTIANSVLENGEIIGEYVPKYSTFEKIK
jgi:hypothetical protein